MDNSWVSDIVLPGLWQLGRLSPEILVCLIGIMMALIYFPRAPRTSLLVAIGLGVLLLSMISSTFSFRLFVYAQRDWDWSTDKVQATFTVLSLAHSVLRGVALGLILWGALLGRGRPGKQVASPFRG